MKIEKQKRKVLIVCCDRTVIRGFIHIIEGQRVMDFLNDSKEVFIAVTSAEMENTPQMRSFKLYQKAIKQKRTIILNKNDIKWIEEVAGDYNA